jgi:hypothetical protein
MMIVAGRLTQKTNFASRFASALVSREEDRSSAPIKKIIMNASNESGMT